MSKGATLSDPSAKTRPWLAAIVVLYLIFAIAYNIITPAGTAIQHNPDENDHVRYVQQLVSGHLPVFTTAAAGSEYHQPPLYYLLCAPVYAATRGMGRSTSIHCMRVVSTILGLFLILAAYRCVRRLFPDQPWTALLTAGLVALLPMNVAMNASVGNDSLTNLLVAAGLMLLTEIAVRSGAMSLAGGEHGDAPVAFDSRRVIQLGVVLGLIILTKSSALVIYPAVLVAFALLGYRKVLTPSIALRSAAIVVGLGLLIGSPWLIRNTVLYGDPLAQKLFLRSFPATAQADNFIKAIGFGPYESLLSKWTFASFWGVFDQMMAWWGRDPRIPGYLPINAPLPAIYNALIILSVVPVVGMLIWLRKRSVDAAQSSLLGAFLLLVFATAYGFTLFTMQFFQAQGRYWFTALVPLALFFALGYRGIFARETWYRVAAVLMLLGLAILNAYTIWGVLVPRFSPGS